MLVLSLMPAAPALAAPAADTAPPQLHSITFERSSATVSGLATQLVGVRVRLTDETGVAPIEYQPSWELASPYLRLNASPNSYIVLRLAEGTDKDGIWTGSLPVTSAWSGDVQPVQIFATDLTYQNRLDVDPRTVVATPSLRVRSSHRPAIDMTFSPEPATAGKPVAQRIRAWDTTTGKPWANLPLWFSFDNGCVEPGGVVRAKTRADGTYQRTLTPFVAQWLQCALVTGTAQPNMAYPPTIIAIDSGFVRYHRFSISAKPAAKSVRARKNVKVTGSISPVVPGKVLQLQRRYPNKTWRKVNTVKVLNNGRYTIVATPPGKGTYSYRIYAPGDTAAVGGTSKVFTIRGT